MQETQNLIGPFEPSTRLSKKKENVCHEFLNTLESQNAV